jgi:hypothetical protein
MSAVELRNRFCALSGCAASAAALILAAEGVIPS